MQPDIQTFSVICIGECGIIIMRIYKVLTLFCIIILFSLNDCAVVKYDGEIGAAITEITKDTTDLIPEKIEVIQYRKGDEQINSVANLPNLVEFHLDHVGQEKLPQFNNCPKLKIISAENNNIKTIAANSLSLTPGQRILLKNNEISTIERGAFGRNLIALFLTCNKLANLKKEWFQNPASLEVLYLDGNNIKIIPKNFFKSFNSLYIISLGYNNLHTISDGAFSNRRNFERLWLNNNQLKELKPTIFSGNDIKVAELRISYNDLTFLSTDFMDRVNVTEAGIIHGNPWKCPCYHLLSKWIPWHNYGKKYGLGPTDSSEPLCIVPLDGSEECVPEVDEEVIKMYRKDASPVVSGEEFCANCRINCD